MGAGDRGRLVKLPVNIVALCDVDSRNLAAASKDHPAARTWVDFRKMLGQQKEIDAVLVSTPDHTHAVVSMMAMKLGKHVVCEKPLARTVSEIRALADAATKYKVATQLDMEGHAFDGLRDMVEWVRAGVIGEVRDVHIWNPASDRPKGWPERPKTAPVPEYLNWDLWLGPAPYRDYHSGLHPASWRGWWDFGTGVLGDWCGHSFDAAVWSLDLGAPSTIEPQWEGDVEEVAWKWSIIKFKFPARGAGMPPVTITWYDGGKMPPRELLPPGESFPAGLGGGYLFVGSKGKILANGRYSYLKSDEGWLLPRERMKTFQAPPHTLPRVPDQEHLLEWLEACKGGKPASCCFEGYGGRLMEIGMLGNVAVRTGKMIEWDSANMRAKGVPEADRFLHAEYRKGWEL